MQRTHEIGVRMALGAKTGQVWWLIARRSLGQLVIGLGLGLAGAFGAGRLLRSLLAQTSATDPLTLGTIAAVFTIASLAAVRLAGAARDPDRPGARARPRLTR